MQVSVVGEKNRRELRLAQCRDGIGQRGMTDGSTGKWFHQSLSTLSQNSVLRDRNTLDHAIYCAMWKVGCACLVSGLSSKSTHRVNKTPRFNLMRFGLHVYGSCVHLRCAVLIQWLMAVSSWFTVCLQRGNPNCDSHTLYQSGKRAQRRHEAHPDYGHFTEAVITGGRIRVLKEKALW